MHGCPNKNKGNYLKKAFKKVNEETQIKILPWVSTKWTLSNWTQKLLIVKQILVQEMCWKQYGEYAY